MSAHCQYLRYVLRHKWFVFLACLQLRVSLWQAIVHDLSKFGPSEWGGYVDYFYRRKDEFQEGRAEHRVADAFAAAWNHHQKHSPHHWEYWLLIDGDGLKPLPMPERFVREMVADWMGAGRAKMGSWALDAWVKQNATRMKFHPATADLLHDILNCELGQAEAAHAIFEAHCDIQVRPN